MSIQRNTAYNIAGAVIPLAISLLTVPVYLKLIGEARYGVLAIAWMLLGYFGLFDLGLGRATAQRIAALRASSVAARAQVFWTAMCLNTLLGVLGGLVLWFCADMAFGDIVKLDGQMRIEALQVIPWLALSIPVATLSSVLNGALQGRELFLSLNVISAASSMFFQLVPLGAAMLWGADLGILLPAALFARLFTLLALFEVCRRHVFCREAVSFSRPEATRLVSFGKWVTLTSIVSPFMIILDRFVIGAVLGAKAVAHYTVPFQLAERSGMIPYALWTALFPRLVGAQGAEENRLARECLRAIVAVMTPVMAAGILLFEPFLSWWISPDFAQQAGLVGRILLVGFWINALGMIPYALLQARGRPDLIAICNLAELLPYLGLLYLGLSWFGIAGAAAAFSLRILADYVLMSMCCGLLAHCLRELLFPALFLLGAFLISTGTVVGSVTWLVLSSLGLLVTAAWAWSAAPLQLRSAIQLPLAKILRVRQV